MKVDYVCLYCNNNFQRLSCYPKAKYCNRSCSLKAKHTDGTVQKYMESYWTPENRERQSVMFKQKNIRQYRKYKPHNEQTKNKISLTKTGIPSPRKGKAFTEIREDKHWNWKGGVTLNDDYRKGRNKRIEYKLWRQSVINRDKQCQMCGSIQSLEAHHIKPYVEYPNFRTDIKNGQTLCSACHLKLESSTRARDEKGRFLSTAIRSAINRE